MIGVNIFTATAPELSSDFFGWTFIIGFTVFLISLIAFMLIATRNKYSETKFSIGIGLILIIGILSFASGLTAMMISSSEPRVVKVYISPEDKTKLAELLQE